MRGTGRLVSTAKIIKRIIDFIILAITNKESELWLKTIDMRLNHKQDAVVSVRRRFFDFPNLIDPAYPMNWDYLEGRILFAQGRLNAVTSWMLKTHAEERASSSIDDMSNQVAERIRDMGRKRASSSGKERYLVIRACGIGFWGEINHVIAQLVFATWTQRRPYVFWGSECLYHDDAEENAFLQYFQPWEDLRIGISGMGSFFPDDFWNKGNVFGTGTRTYSFKSPRNYVGLDVLGQEDDVLIVDTYVSLEVLLKWLPQGHEYGGMSSKDLYRKLFGEYLKLLPEISTQIEGFWNLNMKGSSLVAVHARGGDRTESEGKLLDNDRRYFEKIEAMCPSEEAIFLCTDSEFIYEDFRSRYKDRLVAYPSQRTSGTQGLHTAGSPANRRLAGMETLVEVLLAARCSKFIGCSSNVSGAIDTMGDWEDSYLFHDLPSLTL